MENRQLSSMNAPLNATIAARSSDQGLSSPSLYLEPRQPRWRGNVALPPPLSIEYSRSFWSPQLRCCFDMHDDDPLFSVADEPSLKHALSWTIYEANHSL